MSDDKICLIKLDYDGRLPVDFNLRLRAVLWTHRIKATYIAFRKTRRGWHVTIATYTRVSFMRTILIQSLLGSDWKRELFNSGRANAWSHVPKFWRSRANVLYKRHHREVRL
jgi:hypothetical protein